MCVCARVFRTRAHVRVHAHSVYVYLSVSLSQLDVRVLDTCTRRFKAIMADITGGLCVFTSSCTLPSFLHKFHRAAYLAAETLCVVPEDGFAGDRQRVSKMGKFYLDWLAWRYGLEIVRERRVGRLWVDGFVRLEDDRMATHPLFAKLRTPCDVIIEINGKNISTRSPRVVVVKFGKKRCLAIVFFMLPLPRLSEMLVGRRRSSAQPAE